MKDAKYYLGLPYTIILRRDDEGDIVAKVDELPGCAAHGKTEQEALINLEEVKELWITDCLESGDPVPEPSADEQLPSGKWVQRVPRTLHKKLVDLAKREKVSLNQLITSILSEAVGVRTPTHALRDDDLHSFTSWAGSYGAYHRAYGMHRNRSEVFIMEDAWGMQVKHQQPRRLPVVSVIELIGGRIPNRLEMKGVTYGEKKAKDHQHKAR